MAHILIIDDDQTLCSLLATMLAKRPELACRTVHSIADARKAAAEQAYDIVFLDVGLPDGSGLDLLPQLRCLPAAPEVIIITSAADADGAELAIKNGAWDYVEKPFTNERIILHINRALEYRQAIQSRRLVAFNREKIIGSSSRITECIDMLVQAASGDASVLITGETGTGKELFARAIHENSHRRDNGFIVVDCAALPETLIESVLFGYTKGAFTGADRDRDGLIKQAAGGTLFLDEIGELPLSFQKVFLRVLQERRFRPLGAKNEEHSNFRLVCATNRDLAAMARRGEFRNDLLYRLRAITITVPPLRERPEDLRDLAKFYVAKFCESNALAIKGIAPDFFEALAAYPWPGNIRELINAVEHAASIALDDMLLSPKQLPEHIRIQIARAAIKGKKQQPLLPAATLADLPQLQELRESVLADAERQYLQQLLSRCDGDVEKACSLSGLSRARIYSLLKKYGLSLRR